MKDTEKDTFYYAFEQSGGTLDVKKWVKERAREGKTSYIDVFHDECSIYKNENHKYGWYSKDVLQLLPKSTGKSLHISGLVQEKGWVDKEYLRTGKDRYWNSDRLLDQIDGAIKVAEKKFGITRFKGRLFYDVIPPGLVGCFENVRTYDVIKHWQN